MHKTELQYITGLTIIHGEAFIPFEELMMQIKDSELKFIMPWLWTVVITFTSNCIYLKLRSYYQFLSSCTKLKIIASKMYHLQLRKFVLISFDFILVERKPRKLELNFTFDYLKEQKPFYFHSLHPIKVITDYGDFNLFWIRNLFQRLSLPIQSGLIGLSGRKKNINSALINSNDYFSCSIEPYPP